MKNMRLRAQLAVLMSIFAAYSLAMAVTYFKIQAATQNELERLLNRDIVVLTKLPRLHDELDSFVAATAEYQDTGAVRWLAVRKDIRNQLERTRGELWKGLSASNDADLWSMINKDLSAYLARSDRSLGARRPGSASVDPQLRALMDTLVSMDQQAVPRFRRHKAAALQAARLSFIVTLVTGLAVATLMTLFLSSYIIQPIEGLGRFARQWALGKDWSLAPPPSGPEIREVFDYLAEMSRRLNDQFAKEQQLVQFKSNVVSL